MAGSICPSYHSSPRFDFVCFLVSIHSLGSKGFRSETGTSGLYTVPGTSPVLTKYVPNWWIKELWMSGSHTGTVLAGCRCTGTHLCDGHVTLEMFQLFRASLWKLMILKTLLCTKKKYLCFVKNNKYDRTYWFLLRRRMGHLFSENKEVVLRHHS